MPPSPKAAPAVDLSHASFADLLENLVLADRLAEQKFPLTVQCGPFFGEQDVCKLL